MRKINEYARINIKFRFISSSQQPSITMKTLVLLFTLLLITLANSATLKDRNEEIEPSETTFSEATIGEKKAPAISNIRRNDDAGNSELSTDNSFTNGLSVSLPEERSISLLKKPIIVKKKGGYKVYRDSDEELAQADPKEKCRKEVKVKLCEDESESNTNQMRQDLQLDPISSFEMEHSIKRAKEAVENFQRDLKVMERSSTISGPKENSQTDADTEFHKDIEVARQVLEHIHNNFGNLQSMRVHATTINDEDISNIDSPKTRKVNWEERIHNIQKNIDAGKNIEDRFVVERNNNNDAEIQEDIDLHKIVEKNDSDPKNSGSIALDSKDTASSCKSLIHQVKDGQNESSLGKNKLQNVKIMSKHNEENSEMSITKDINPNIKLHSDNLRLEPNSNVQVTPQKRENALLLKSTDSSIGIDQNNIETLSDDNTHGKRSMPIDIMLSDTKSLDENKKEKIQLNNLHFKEKNSENSHTSLFNDMKAAENILKNLRIKEENTQKSTKIDGKDDENLRKSDDVMNEKSATKLNNNMVRTSLQDPIFTSNDDESKLQTSHLFQVINTEKEKIQHMKSVENANGNIMTLPFDDHLHVGAPTGETTNNFEVERIQNPHFNLERNDENNMLLHQPLKENNQLLDQMKIAEEKDHEYVHRGIHQYHGMINDKNLNRFEMSQIHENGDLRNTPNELSEMQWVENNVQKLHNMRNDESTNDEHLKKTSFVEHSHQIPTMRRSSPSNLHMEHGDMQINSALHELRNHEGQLTNGQFNHQLNNRPTLRLDTEFGKKSSMDGHHNFNIPSTQRIASEMIPVNAMFHHGKNPDMDNIVQASQHMHIREALQPEYAQQWFNKHGMSSRSNYMQQPSNVPSTVTGSYGSTSSGAVGLFPNANTGGCAIPLLLSCSPSVVSGTLAKGHSSYSAPSYRSMDEFRYHNKRETHNEGKKLVNKNHPTVITKLKVQPATNKTP
ncbi:unnamed protein product [Parnassius apollo]|uniref:(apollo) hypothetical protein n=1 Tax=Parnassius apollo TaxID=110799 RepID=A0A8S3WYR8_PARAO|nr:unnamed protein product [Parnassius apollo]